MRRCLLLLLLMAAFSPAWSHGAAPSAGLAEIATIQQRDELLMGLAAISLQEMTVAQPDAYRNSLGEYLAKQPKLRQATYFAEDACARLLGEVVE